MTHWISTTNLILIIFILVILAACASGHPSGLDAANADIWRAALDGSMRP